MNEARSLAYIREQATRLFWSRRTHVREEPYLVETAVLDAVTAFLETIEGNAKALENLQGELQVASPRVARHNSPIADRVMKHLVVVLLSDRSIAEEHRLRSLGR